MKKTVQKTMMSFFSGWAQKPDNVEPFAPMAITKHGGARSGAGRPKAIATNSNAPAAIPKPKSNRGGARTGAGRKSKKQTRNLQNSQTAADDEVETHLECTAETENAAPIETQVLPANSNEESQSSSDDYESDDDMDTESTLDRAEALVDQDDFDTESENYDDLDDGDEEEPAINDKAATRWYKNTQSPVVKYLKAFLVFYLF